jgi:hypothetical protein
MKTLNLVLGTALALGIGMTNSHAMSIAPGVAASSSAPIILAANGCGGGRYRGPYGSCHRFGHGPYPGGYYGAYVHRFCWWGHGARHCTRR